MPSFSAFPVNKVAKPGVISDGELVTVGSDGYTVTSTLSSYSAFLANPSRSATGVWSVTMKDPAYKIIDINVKTLVTAGTYLGAQLNPTTADSQGRLVVHWTFNSSGTPTDLPASGKFSIYVVYGETSIA